MKFCIGIWGEGILNDFWCHGPTWQSDDVYEYHLKMIFLNGKIKYTGLQRKSIILRVINKIFKASL